ncbi:RCC1 domain-containing protein [Solwaraspora sp. WMMB762]|uniref:RCC1 domain-containing protein n=1 Tax=Solwaraspora sp. WMMB762 TaxID=3404120 RepID=UPI003B95BAF8
MAAVLAIVLVIGHASAGYAAGVPSERSGAAAVPQSAGAEQVPAGLGAVTAVAAGAGHSLALRSDGTVVAWGRNVYGRLGIGHGESYLTPVQVCAVGETAPCRRFLTGVIAIAVGTYHSVALLRDRTVVAWGWNIHGQVGDGTSAYRLTPVQVCAVGQVAPCGEFLRGVRALSANGNTTLAQLTTGAAVAWGSNLYGQLGDGTTLDRHTPVQVCAVGQVAPCERFLTGVRSLAVGGQHSMAVVDNALAVAWGFNQNGQLGDGTTLDRRTPVRVCAVGQVAPCDRFLNAVRAVAGHLMQSMALLGDGSVVTWGYNGLGQLGDGTTVNRLTPVRVCAVGQAAPCERFLYGVRQISAGGNHSAAQLSSGGVVTWGFNDNGELGDGTDQSRSTPVRVCAVGQADPCTRYLVLIRAISVGGSHNLALQPDYSVVAWGLNNLGQLGDGTTEARRIPVQVRASWP